MSNNSGVTPEGLEMGRAQIVQAVAARIPPHVDMNPILLKPTSDVGSQIVLKGKAIANSTASEYHHRKDDLFSGAVASLDRLRANNDLVVIEGAGSCAEVNLMSHDIVNFRIAQYADAPVVLVADIHRGGVFGQIVGTLACLKPDQQERITGFIINRFRGDADLFSDGVKWIEQKTGKKVYGVHPWYTDLTIESEDSVVIENPKTVSPDKIEGPAIAVIRIPHISNFTDIDPLASIEGLQVCFLEKRQDLKPFSAVILPGSKNTRFDLEWLHNNGWSKEINQFADNNGYVLGVCGGFQMLGEWVHDPNGLEGSPGSTPGLSLLPVETTLQAPKTTTLTRFNWNGSKGWGYEIHMGQTKRKGGRPVFSVIEQNGRACHLNDGCEIDQYRVMGTYIHGLFDAPAIAERWLNIIGLADINIQDIYGPAARDRDLDRLAEHFETHVDLAAIAETVGINIRD
jgi:adenosylcobyric acid synthase